MTEEHKNWIDGANYEMLLRRWRFGKPGTNLIFMGDTGKYYGEMMAMKKRQLGQQKAVEVSKRIGWDYV